jgi:hypothetical protein
VAGIEVFAAAAAHELIDPSAGELRDEPALHEHCKTFTFTVRTELELNIFPRRTRGSSAKTATTGMKLGSISTVSDFFVEVFASFFIRFGLFAGVTGVLLMTPIAACT